MSRGRFLPVPIIISGALALLAGCGAKVAIDTSIGTGGTGGGTTTSTGVAGGAGGCGGETFGCAQFCGSDFFPANAACVDGAWQCPPDTVDPKTCPPPVQVCCGADWQCGDEIFVPCVNGVCKPPIPDACWSDEECNGLACVDAFVCPCDADCTQPDHPGFCEGPP